MMHLSRHLIDIIFILILRLLLPLTLLPLRRRRRNGLRTHATLPLQMPDVVYSSTTPTDTASTLTNTGGETHLFIIILLLISLSSS
jgi:hypothetical protein